VVEFDPETLVLLSQVVADKAQADAWGFGGATAALKVGGELWIGSFTGERIAKFRNRLT
jgi:hypothetical protein